MMMAKIQQQSTRTASIAIMRRVLIQSHLFTVALLVAVSKCSAASHFLKGGVSAAASIEQAWDAVDSSWQIIDINEPLTNLSADTDELLMYAIQDIPKDHSVICKLAGGNGDADLFLNLVANTSYAEESTCFSTGNDSYESCEVSPIRNISTLFILVKAFVAFTDLTLTCKAHDAYIEMQDGVPLGGQTIKRAHIQTYFLADIPALMTATCQFKAPNGVPYIFARFVDTIGDEDFFDSCWLGSGAFKDSFAECRLHAQTEPKSGLAIDVDAANEDVVIWSLVVLSLR